MRNDLVEVVFVLDRSGSMDLRKSDTQGGLNEFVRQQKLEPGEVNFTLVQFDDQYEVVYSGPIANFPEFVFHPRGITALNDAICKAIVDTGERLKNMPEDQLPGLVTFVILTDGLENASKEYTRQQVKDMIEHQSTKYSWKFLYLGANQDAICVGQSYSMSVSANYNNIQGALYSSSENVKRMRKYKLDNVDSNEIDCQYTQDELNLMN